MTLLNHWVWKLLMMAPLTNKQGGLVMKFNEALQELLKGKKVRKGTWPATEYIYLVGDLVLTDNNKRYQMNRVDMEANWEIYNDIHEGTILHRYDGNFAVVLNTHGKYAIINTSTWKMLLDGIDQDKIELYVGNLDFETVS